MAQSDDEFKADEIKKVLERAIRSDAAVTILYTKNGDPNSEVQERIAEPKSIKVNKQGDEYVATIVDDEEGERFRSFSLKNIHMAIDF